MQVVILLKNILIKLVFDIDFHFPLCYIYYITEHTYFFHQISDVGTSSLTSAFFYSNLNLLFYISISFISKPFINPTKISYFLYFI